MQVLTTALADELNRGPARPVQGRAAAVRAAAQIQGTAAHAAEVDASCRDAMVHPGAATTAAARAVGQSVSAGGPDFLHAVVLGCEISTRIGVVMGRLLRHRTRQSVQASVSTPAV